MTGAATVQSIELLLDEDAEAALRGSWDALDAAGLPSLATHTGETNRPHVTLAVAETGPDGERPGFLPAIERVRAVFAGWDLAGAGVAATAGAPLLFGGHKHRWVLARQIVPTWRLLTMHASLHHALREAEAEESPQTVPDAWTPHVSLARRMPGDRLDEALQLVVAEPLPCRFVGARLWDSATKTVVPLA